MRSLFRAPFLFILLHCLFVISEANAENLSISDKTRFQSLSSIKVPVTQYIPGSKTPGAIGSNMLFLKDPEHSENIASIMKGQFEWQRIKRQSPNFGFTDIAYWFKFNIENNSDTDQEIYIELPIPFLDSVQVYRTKDAVIKEQHFVGDTYPFTQRPIAHQNFVLPFTLASGNNIMYMRVASAGTVEAPLLLWHPANHAKASSDNNLFQGIWAGMIAIMVIYNLLLFFSIRDASYLYYVVFAFGYLFFQVSLKGYGFAYIWPNMLDWNSYCISTFVALCNLSVVLLVIKFLNLKSTNPPAFKLMRIIAFFSGFILLLSFIAPYSFAIRIASATTLITCSLSLVLGYIALYRGQQDARYFCLAWTATFIGIGVLGAVKFGIFTANFWTNNSGQIGVICLVSLLSLALASRINREKEMRLIAQDAALTSETTARQSQADLLEAKTNANFQLEEKVTERTKTMQKALSELEQANGRLELASTTDALTTLFNRRHFESRLNIEFKRALRHKRELSIILCDIDYFKTVNDTHGHKAGDECLRHVALILKNIITRSGDIIARYGGEEFIILLVDTPLKEAEYLAETLCKEIRNTLFESNNRAIDFTASFGVSSLSQHQSENPEILVSRADIALYDAKHSGRDQVKTWKNEGSE
jgi:diguanylate cyclase (GGDEF)-like protein